MSQEPVGDARRYCAAASRWADNARVGSSECRFSLCDYIRFLSRRLFDLCAQTERVDRAVVFLLFDFIRVDWRQLPVSCSKLPRFPAARQTPRVSWLCDA